MQNNNLVNGLRNFGQIKKKAKILNEKVDHYENSCQKIRHDCMISFLSCPNIFREGRKGIF